MLLCPLAPFVIKEVSIPGNGMVYAQAFCNDFPKVPLWIMQLPDLPARKDARRSPGRLFIICCQHIDPDDENGDVYLRMFLDQYLLHRPGAV